MSFPYFGETKELNDSTRKEADGSFVALPDGVTHYELSGTEQGAPIVLVHGFSVPYFIFDPTFEFLTRSGFRVLRYDLFGRGWSDRPNAAYNVHFFVKQLHDLLNALNIEKATLAGLSMGGPIAASFADRHPDRVNKLIFIDPAGARKLQGMPILEVPILGELLFGVFGNWNLVKSLASDFFDPALVEHFQNQYRVQLQFKGFKRAILSTLRNNMLDSFIETYQNVGKMNKPTLLFFGRNDTTVPFDHSADLCKAIPHIEFHVVDGCGHIPHYEKPDVVNPILLKFLQKEALP